MKQRKLWKQGTGEYSPANLSYARALAELAERFIAVRMD